MALAPLRRHAAGAAGSWRDLGLDGYWRSSSSWRVRIALCHHGVAFDNRCVHLVKGEQFDPDYVQKNKLQQVPTLTFADSAGARYSLTQSMAIIDFLDAAFVGQPGAGAPLVPLADSPQGALLRARALQFAEICNSAIQPFQNLSTLKLVKAARLEAGGEEVSSKAFAASKIAAGLAACEALAAAGGPFAVGAQPTIADACLVPQLYSARRFGVDLEVFPSLLRAEAACAELPAFKAAHADVQPDAF